MHHTTVSPIPDPGAETANGAVTARRQAAAALGSEMRALVEDTVSTTAPAEELHRLAHQVRALREGLRAPSRESSQIPDVDVFPRGPRVYNPASGAGHPFAPPMLVTPTRGGLRGSCTLGLTHEGPPGFAHGGMSAMLLDDLMGWACTAAGVPSMTISLRTRYHRPVPLQTPLRVLARITSSKDRKITMEGSIATEAAPDASLVSADAVFLEPDPAQARVLFPNLP